MKFILTTCYHFKAAIILIVDAQKNMKHNSLIKKKERNLYEKMPFYEMKHCK